VPLPRLATKLARCCGGMNSQYASEREQGEAALGWGTRELSERQEGATRRSEDGRSGQGISEGNQVMEGRS
jgi:hypothetical protein